MISYLDRNCSSSFTGNQRERFMHHPGACVKTTWTFESRIYTPELHLVHRNLDLKEFAYAHH